MDIMYWEFPHLDGVWSVAAGNSRWMQSTTGGCDIAVVWVNGRPFNRNNIGTRVVEKSTNAHEPIKAHYAKLAIEPFEYSMKNGLDAMQHTIVKYVTRFRDKGGIRDLEAARKTIDLLIAYEKEQQCSR